MSDNKLSEDDEEELIPVDKPISDARDDNDEEDDEDERLAEGEDDPEGDTSPNRKKRLKRRQVQKIAKESAQRELRMLREQNEQMAKRLAAVEGNALSHNEMALDTRINDAQTAVRQAEQIIARAVEAGNGDDVAAAIRMRDEAIQRANQLTAAKQQVHQVREQPAAPDPRVKSLAQEWMEANSWYDPKGGNEESAITNAIDARLTAEGYDPTTRKYWKELTKRVSARIGEDTESQKSRSDRDDHSAKKKAPPMGKTREHAPQSTKKEVYVTPERKQAMMDAGIWDDPVRRNQMLKAYQAYDRNSAR
jgi:hypothetical protein